MEVDAGAGLSRTTEPTSVLSELSCSLFDFIQVAMSSAHSVTRFVKRQEALSYRRETALRSKLLSRRSQQRERLNASMLSIYLFVCLFVSVAKIQKKLDFLKN